MDGAIAGSCISMGIKEFNNNGNTISLYPNPFENTTTFLIVLTQDATVNLNIIDVAGKLITNVLNEQKSQGEVKIVFDRKQLTSGIYFYQLKINNIITTGKIIVQ